MSLLIIQTTASGIFYHRQLSWAYRWTQSGKDFDDDMVVIVDANNKDKIRHWVDNHHFDIVFFSIGIHASLPEDMPRFIEFMKARGSKVVLDIDDLYRGRADVNKAIRDADALTTVSEFLAKQYINRSGNRSKVYVIENALDVTQRQFQYHPTANDNPVFGYLGSTRHEADLAVMDYDFSTRELLVVCEEYKDILNVSHYTTLKHWTEYAWEYNAINVALAPLVPEPFNDSKSFLKVIEAGFKKKAIICSDTQPYNRDIHSEFHPVIDLIKVGDSWQERVEDYTVEEATQRGEELFELVQPFEVKVMNQKRRQIYEDILKDAKPIYHIEPRKPNRAEKRKLTSIKRGSNQIKSKKKKRR